MNDATPNTPIDMKADIAQALRDATMLVDIVIRRWDGKVRDDSVLDELKTNNDVTAVDFGKFTKTLLADNDSKLKALHKALNEARTTHYRLTAPFSEVTSESEKRRGARLLAKVHFMRYMREMEACKDKVKRYRDEFVADYPRAMQAAIEKLGKLGHEAEYPSAADIAGRFEMRYTFEPIPSTAGFNNLPDRVTEALSEKTNQRLQSMYDTAVDDAWTRTQEAVEHMIERFTGLDAKGKPKVFRDSMIANMRDAVTLLEGIDVEQNPQRQAVVEQIKSRLCHVSAGEIRKDESVRQSLRTNAEAILRNMEGVT